VAESVLSELGLDIRTYTLVASSGGVHDYEIDGELVFSKKLLGRQPTPDEIVAIVRERLDGRR
jgi:selenoprotein W-related protein